MSRTILQSCRHLLNVHKLRIPQSVLVRYFDFICMIYRRLVVSFYLFYCRHVVLPLPQGHNHNSCVDFKILKANCQNSNIFHQVQDLTICSTSNTLSYSSIRVSKPGLGPFIPIAPTWHGPFHAFEIATFFICANTSLKPIYENKIN